MVHGDPIGPVVNLKFNVFKIAVLVSTGTKWYTISECNRSLFND